MLVGEGRVANSTNAQGAKARAISTSAVITTGSSQAITKSVVAAIKIITTTRALKLSSSINRRIGLAIMELMIAIKRHQLLLLDCYRSNDIARCSNKFIRRR